MQFYRDHFGKKLKEAINKASKTQQNVADHLQIEPATVSRWANGIDFPNEKKLPELCKFLGVEISYFGFDQSSISADRLIDYLFKNKDLLPMLPKVPSDLIKLLADQDDIAFAAVRKVLEGLAQKKTPVKPKEKARS